MTVFGMTFNYADLAILAIFLIAAVIGFYRGIVMNVINFIRLSVGSFLCFFTAENASQPVYEQWVKPKLVEAVSHHIADAVTTEELTEKLNAYMETLPKVIADNVNLQGLDFSAEDVADSIVTSVFEPVVLFLVKAALFIAVFLVFFGVTWLMIHFVKKALKSKDRERGHTTLLRKTDKFLGLLFGLFKAAVIVLAISSVLVYILQLKPQLAEESQFWSQIGGSTLIENIKEMNPFNAITEGYI